MPDDQPIHSVRMFARRPASDWVFLPRDETVNNVGSARIAIKRGAIGAVITKPYEGPLPIYSVGEGFLSNLHKVAAAARKRLDGKVVAITGSVGKTSTTHMALSMFDEFGSTFGTKGNMNTARQSVIQMINAPRETDYCVFEAASGLGGLGRRSRVLRPSVAVITKIGFSHMETHGSRERLAQNKFSLADYLEDSGAVVCDKEGLDFAIASGSKSAIRIAKEAITVGPDGDIAYNDIDVTAEGVRAKLAFRGNTFHLSMSNALPYHIHSASLVFGTAAALGLDLNDVMDALNNYSPSVARRMERHAIVSSDGGRALLVDDAYNASIESFTAAITHMQHQEAARKILVFGDMLELGQISERMHDSLIPLIDGAAFDLIYAVGEQARRIGAKLGSAPVVSCSTAEQAALHLLAGIEDGDVVLLKGSKGIGLKTVVEKAVKTG